MNCILPRTARTTDFGTLCLFSCLWMATPMSYFVFWCGHSRDSNVFFFLVFFTLLLSSFWTSRGHRCCPFPPRFLPSIFIEHRVQQSRCWSIFHRVLLTHALTPSASQFGHKQQSLRIYTSVHSGGVGTHETDPCQAGR